MRLHLFTNFILILLASASNAQNERFSQRAVNTSYTLNAAWEITYGPNDSLWVTENKAYLVSRINVANGSKTVLLNLLGTTGDNSINFSETGGGNKPRRVKPAQYPQGGLMGLALHPALYSSDAAIRKAKPWVYIAYVYNYVISAGCSSSSPCYYYSKIVRYNYSGSTLSNPVIILDSIPGSNDHNSGRLKIGPDNKLYYTVGDMGAGQFNNTNRPNNALNPNSLEGKVLRLNTEPDGGAGKEAWVPNDNPFYTTGAVTPSDYVYTLGHRNAQGLDWAVINENNFLYSSEHGDKSDDEVNRIAAGGNYGWNQVSGYCDGNYDGKKLGGYTPVNEGAFCPATPNYVNPIFTMFTSTASEINSFYNNTDAFTFNTVAPSSIETYTSTAIPGWKNSLLVSCLKAGRVYRVQLDSAGTGITPLANGVDTAVYFAGLGRFRDLAISPDGLKIYVACELVGSSSGPSGGFNTKSGAPTPANAGKIMEFTYAGASTPASRMAPSFVAQEQTISSFNVFPNPATNKVTVLLNGRSMLYTIQVFDMNGRRLRSVRAARGSAEVNLQGLARGVYTIRIADERNRVQMIDKIVKQ